MHQYRANKYILSKCLKHSALIQVMSLTHWQHQVQTKPDKKITKCKDILIMATI